MLRAAALHKALELVVGADLGPVGRVLDPIAAATRTEGRVLDLHPVTADRAGPTAHDRQPTLMGRVADIAPRIAVKDEVQRRRPGRDLHRARERHPPDRDVAHARSEIAARHRRRRPSVGRDGDHARLRAAAPRPVAARGQVHRVAALRLREHRRKGRRRGMKVRGTGHAGKEGCQSSHDEGTENPACHSMHLLWGRCRHAEADATRGPCGWTARDRDTAQTLVAPEGTPAPDRWSPLPGESFRSVLRRTSGGPNAWIMPPAAGGKRGRSTHRSTAATRRRDR